MQPMCSPTSGRPRVRHQLQRNPTWIKCYSYLTITSEANRLRTAYGDIDRRVSTGGAASGCLGAAVSTFARLRDRGPSEAAGLGSRIPGDLETGLADLPGHTVRAPLRADEHEDGHHVFPAEELDQEGRLQVLRDRVDLVADRRRRPVGRGDGNPGRVPHDRAGQDLDL